VSGPPTRGPRVLLSNLTPMTRLGMEEVLATDGIEVVRGDGGAGRVLAAVRRLRPDAVVLGMDRARSRALGERIRAAAPRVKLILWARDEEAMEVFDPGSPTPRRITPPRPRALLGEFADDRLSSGRN